MTTNNEQWECRYKELVTALGIHLSHDHEQVLAYVQVYNDRGKVTQEVISLLGPFSRALSELEKKTW